MWIIGTLRDAVVRCVDRLTEPPDDLFLESTLSHERLFFGSLRRIESSSPRKRAGRAPSSPRLRPAVATAGPARLRDRLNAVACPIPGVTAVPWLKAALSRVEEVCRSGIEGEIPKARDPAGRRRVASIPENGKSVY